MRRIGVICSILIAGSLGTWALTAPQADVAPAAEPSLREKLDLGVVAIDAVIAGDPVRSSGTVIAADEGLVLTSAHAVWGATSIRVATGIGVLHGRIVARAPCDNLAVVDTQPRLPGLIALPAGEAPARGALLTAIGRRRAGPEPAGETLLTIPARSQADGIRVQIDPLLPPLDDAVQLDGSLVPEATGGPILDDAGRLVAIAQVTDSAQAKRNTAVAWSTVRRRLDELAAGPRRLFVGWRYQYRCAKAMNAYTRADHPGFRPGDARLNAPVPATRLPGTGELDE